MLLLEPGKLYYDLELKIIATLKPRVSPTDSARLSRDGVNIEPTVVGLALTSVLNFQKT